MSSLNEHWLQDVAESIKLPALKPSVCKLIVPSVEMQIRKVLEQAQKFQKRSKSSKLTGMLLVGNSVLPFYFGVFGMILTNIPLLLCYL